MQPIPSDCPSKGEWRIARQLAREAIRNAKFATLTPAQKRVGLAKDVIKWMASGKLIAAGQDGASGYLEAVIPYAEAPARWTDTYSVPDGYVRVPTQAFRDAGKVNGYACTACAIGGLFAAAVERDLCKLTNEYGNVTSEDGASGIWGALSRAGLFEKDQVVLIELAYEHDKCLPRDSREAKAGLDQTLVGRAIAFSEVDGLSADFERPARLEAIMRNIIANKGTFAP